MKRNRKHIEANSHYTPVFVNLVCRLKREWAEEIDILKVGEPKGVGSPLTKVKKLIQSIAHPWDDSLGYRERTEKSIHEYFNASPMPYDPSSEMSGSMMRAAQAYRWAMELKAHGADEHVQALELLCATILNTPVPGSVEAEVLGGD